MSLTSMLDTADPKYHYFMKLAHHIYIKQVVQRTWDWLAEQPEDAAELAQLLFEATPRLGVAAARCPRKLPRNRRHSADANLTLVDRLRAAEPLQSGMECPGETRDETSILVNIVLWLKDFWPP